MSLVSVDVDYGADIVLLPDVEARTLANEQTPPDANNRWQWRADGTDIEAPDYGPPSLHIEQPAADALYEIVRAPTSATDTRELPTRPQRRWRLRVQHRHYTVVLPPGVATQPLRESLAVRWVRWPAPPDWTALLATLNVRLAEFRRNPAPDPMLYALLRMTLRPTDSAWLWTADPTRSMHANGPPPFVSYLSWASVEAALGTVPLRDVLVWLGVVEVRRGIAIDADAGLWLAESSSGTVLAAYEVFALGQSALPTPIVATSARTQRLSDAVSLVQVQLDAGTPPTVDLTPTAPAAGVMRWYRVPIPDAPTPWEGTAAQMHALINSMCIHCAPQRLAEAPRYTVRIDEILDNTTRANTLLAGDAVAFAVLGFAELDDPPAELPHGLAVEPGVVVPRHTQEPRPPRYNLRIGMPAAPTLAAPFPTLAWREFVGGVVVVAYRPPRAPAPISAPIAAPITPVDIRGMRPFAPYRPPPLGPSAADPASVTNSLMLYRVWCGRQTAHRMVVSFAARRNIGLGEAVQVLGTLDLSQLGAEAGLYRAITGDHDAVWMPPAGRAELLAPLVLEDVPMFGNDRLLPAFVLWLSAAAIKPLDMDTLGAELPDSTLQHMARERNRIIGLLRAQQAGRRLMSWLIEQYNSLDASDTPLETVLAGIERFQPQSGAIVAHVRACLTLYANAVVQYRPPVRHPPRADESVREYAARLTVEMLQPDVVSRALALIDTQAAGTILLMRELPVTLFPTHWTEIDLHSALPLAGHAVESLRAARYVGPGASLETADDDEYLVGDDVNPVALLQLSSADPARRTHEERQRTYEKWRDIFLAQADAAYRLTGDGAPRPLPMHAPTASALLHLLDAIPAPPAVLRVLRAEREQRLQQLAPHEARIRMLHTPNGIAPDTPPMPAFFRGGGWANQKLADAARAYFAAYLDMLRAYALFSLAQTALTAVNTEWANLERAIQAISDDHDRESRRRAAEAIRAPITPSPTTAPTPGGDAAAPGAALTPAPEPALTPFAAAALAWIQTLSQALVWDKARHELEARLNDRANPPTQAEQDEIMRRIIAEVASVAPPPPARLTALMQVSDRYYHMLLMFAGDVAPSDEIKAAMTPGSMDIAAITEFTNKGREAAAALAATLAFTTVDDFRTMHLALWRTGMRAALDLMQYDRALHEVLVALTGKPIDRAAAQEQQRRLEMQRGGRFFRPHPREASFLSAALNTLTMADPDPARDATSLQRSVWARRLQQLDVDARQPQADSLLWTAAERRQMLLARKTPDMLARIAVRWAMRDFVARGPEVRFQVPALLLERLLWALLESPDFFDARERYGLDSLDTGSTIAQAFVATWRTDSAYDVVSDVTAGALLTLMADQAPNAATLFAQLATRMQMGTTMLWRRALFGWSTAPSVGITRDLDVRTVAELALFVIALDQAVTAAIKTLATDDATQLGAIERVGLLHVCFAWLVAYVMPHTGRIFVQRRHPSGQMLYDDFTAAVVPMLMREVYADEAMARTPIDAEWRQAWMRLTGGWLQEDFAPDLSRERLRDYVFRPAVEQQRQLLWRYTPAADPLNPLVPLSAGAVSLFARYEGSLVDVSPLARIDRRATFGNNNDDYRPEGRDIVYNEQNNDFVPNPAYAFYEWRVGQECFLRPAYARDTNIDTAPAADADALLRNVDAIELWPDNTPLMRWFERWSARGWRRRPSKENALAVRRAILRGEAVPKLPDAEAMEDVRFTQEAGARHARNELKARLQAALDAGAAESDPAPLPIKTDDARAAGVRQWTDRGASVVAPAYRLLEAIDVGPDAQYTDEVHADLERQVDLLVRGIELYSMFYNRSAAVVAGFLADLPRYS